MRKVVQLICMARSIKKGYFCAEAVTRKVRKAVETGSKSPIKIMSRASVITEDCIGLTFKVHNGKLYVPLKATPEHVGRKFGEYSDPKRFGGHGGDKKTVGNKKSSVR